MKKIVDGVLMDMTAEEEAAHLAAPEPVFDAPTPPTKEQLMAELAALTAKIQALE
jgi:hypothetical protein